MLNTSRCQMKWQARQQEAREALRSRSLVWRYRRLGFRHKQQKHVEPSKELEPGTVHSRICRLKQVDKQQHLLQQQLQDR